MRNTLSVACSIAWLLAMPGLAAAQYDNGGTSQAAPAPQSPATPQAPPAPSAPPTPSAEEPLNVEESDANCRAAWKEYLASLACFAPYRHSAHVLDIEAFKHCKVVKEPNCPRPLP
ncbi:MAG TPA: hypothetical protein VKC56_07210 [Gallionellaceae bacterium]|nr:hypothetical protein [Gallionellaceae bacterium]